MRNKYLGTTAMVAATLVLSSTGAHSADKIKGADPDNADEVLLWTVCERAD